MQFGVKLSNGINEKQLAIPGESNSPPDVDSQEEMNLRLVELLGEVIRMSQAWVRALESVDPFTADKYEAKCIVAMERFEANRKKTLSRSDSLEQTR
jgi:hypothetical protein